MGRADDTPRREEEKLRDTESCGKEKRLKRKWLESGKQQDPMNMSIH